MTAYENADQVMFAVEEKRQKIGMTVKELSERSGVSLSALKKWLDGATKPTLYGTALLLEALNMKMMVGERE